MAGRCQGLRFGGRQELVVDGAHETVEPRWVSTTLAAMSDDGWPKEHPPVVIDVPAETQPIRPTRMAESQAGGGPPIHPLAAVLLLVVDNLWNLADWLVIDWIITIPLSFITVFLPVFLIQKVLKKNRVGQAFGYALLLGVIAAIPTSLTGTPVGLALLAWTGVSKLIGRPLGR